MANPFFNAEYYLEQNADVAEAVGGDEALAEQHYFLHGAGEADRGDNVDRKPAPWFDIEFYRASREDLADVPAEQLFLHFTLHGIGEGLSPAEGIDFDPVAYASAEGNEDLLEAFGIEDVENLTEEQQEQLAQHFFAHGYKEGREGGPDIPGWDEDGSLADLAAALEAKQEADQAVIDYLKNAPELEFTDGTTRPAEGEDLEAGDIADYLTDALTDVVNAFGGEADDSTPPADFINMEADLQDEFIAAEQARLKAKVSEATAAAPDNAAALLAAVDSATEKLLSAMDAEAETAAEEQKVTDAFEGYHGGSVYVVDGAEYADPTGTADGDHIVFNGKLYAVGADGAASLDDLTEATDAKYGADLLAAVAAAAAAATAAASAETALQTAVAKVYLAENEAHSVAEDEDYSGVITVTKPDLDAETDGAVEIDFSGTLSLHKTDADDDTAAPFGAPLTGTLETALADQEAFADAVAKLAVARDLSDELEVLQTAADDALAAIVNSPDDEDAPGLGIALVDLDTDGFAETATADTAELFLFNEEIGGSIAGFGEEHLLFFGTQYTFVELDADFDFEGTRTGDNEVLEIFYQVQGSDTVFYVENDAGAAHDLDLSNITTVTLTGVTGVDVAEDLGFVGLAA